MFLDAFHSAGRLVSEDTPLPSGPRHCDQFVLGSASEGMGLTAAIAITQVIQIKSDGIREGFIVAATPCMNSSVVLRNRSFIDYAEEVLLSAHKQFVIGNGNRDATRFAD